MKSSAALYKKIIKDKRVCDRLLSMTGDGEILEEIVKLSNKHKLPVTVEDLRPFLCRKSDGNSQTGSGSCPA